MPIEILRNERSLEVLKLGSSEPASTTTGVEWTITLRTSGRSRKEVIDRALKEIQDLLRTPVEPEAVA